MRGISNEKPAARKRAFARRKAAHASTEQGAACDALLAYLAPYRGRRLAGYMPIYSEIDPRPVMTEMARHGPVCVPVIERAGAPLSFRFWSPTSSMVEGAFGALIPQDGAEVTPEVLIVPLVAFGPGRNRLGYGGGFYDRTLEGLRARGKTLAVGFAFSAQHDAHIPFERADQTLDAIVTENGLWAGEDGIDLAASADDA